ncbi:hypothetical protein [Pseudonocardia yuanmonensis]|uniref:hypothetical protein n=1 Tax=Pseudonocardia yuanmonensis TaxID=1095914 RepID=UPI0031ED70D8
MNADRATIAPSSAEDTGAPEPHRARRLRPSTFVVPAAVAVVAVLVVATPPLRTVENAIVILRAAALTGIVAIGMTFVTLAGMFFSLASAGTTVLSGIVFALLADSQGLVIALLAALGVGLVAGALQGWVAGVAATRSSSRWRAASSCPGPRYWPGTTATST